MDLDKILKMIENGNHHLLIPMATKASPSLFLAVSDAAKKKGEAIATYIRNAVCVQVDHDNQPADLTKAHSEKQTAKELKIDKQNENNKNVSTEKSLFVLEALKKYIMSESIPLPSENEIIKYWPDDGMSKNNIEFMIEALKKYIISTCKKTPTEGDLVRLWVHGKKVAAPFCRWRVLVEPQELPRWLAEKFGPAA